MFCPRITANVARLAAERGLSVEGVAERAGVKPAFLSPGGLCLGGRRVKALAKALGVEPQNLVSDPSRPEPGTANPDAIAVAAHVAANIARLLAERGFTVARVARRPRRLARSSARAEAVVAGGSVAHLGDGAGATGMISPFHVRRIAIADHDARHEWPFEIADESGRTVLAMPIEASITPPKPEPDAPSTLDEGLGADQLSAEAGGGAAVVDGGLRQVRAAPFGDEAAGCVDD